MFTSFSCWCFDFDGTLVDQWPRYQAVHISVIEEMGGQPVNNYLAKRRSGRTEFEVFNETGLPLAQFQAYFSAREKKLEDPQFLDLDRVFPAAHNLLSFLRSTGAKTWVLTYRSNYELLSQQIIDFKLNKFVDKWQCAKQSLSIDIDASTTPSQETAIAAAASKKEILWGLRQRWPTVMIGDSRIDIEAARQAGIQSIAIPTGLYDRQCLLQASPDYLFNSLEELLSALTDEKSPLGG
jgi:phosphoglycolate phosphatase-like HAD superfamily hydrolase